MLPALGVPAGFYRRLAEALGARGVDVVLVEQRGHGRSPYQARRGAAFGYRDYLEQDIPAAIAWTRARLPGHRLFLGGHSLGGHMSSIATGRTADGEIEGVVHLACGFPYHGLFAGRSARMVKLLCFLIPPLVLLFGYYPGDRVGFGGREFGRLMLDWRKWATGDSYDSPATPDAEAGIGSYRGRVLSVAFEQDTFASEAAIAYSYSRFKSVDVTALTLGRAEQGDYLGHFDWAKKPDGAAGVVADWIG
jgi:predicted alpha/beta hydrolase